MQLLPRFLSVMTLIAACSACAPAIVNRDPLPVVVKEKPAAPAPNGSIYQHNNSRFLFEDRKARRRGDLITVILDERTIAEKNASTTASRTTAVDIPAPTLLGKVPTLNGNSASTSLQSGTDFNGTGDSSQSNSLLGNITVTVTDVRPNGILVISGEKQLTLNSGLEIISISGLVRPTDLSPQNTIMSNLIADANIVYSGKGMIADTNRGGWLTRVLTSRFWPF